MDAKFQLDLLADHLFSSKDANLGLLASLNPGELLLPLPPSPLPASPLPPPPSAPSSQEMSSPDPIFGADIGLLDAEHNGDDWATHGLGADVSVAQSPIQAPAGEEMWYDNIFGARGVDAVRRLQEVQEIYSQERFAIGGITRKPFLPPHLPDLGIPSQDMDTEPNATTMMSDSTTAPRKNGVSKKRKRGVTKEARQRIRRQKHNECEVRRRQAEKELFAELKQITHFKDGKQDQVTVLQHAITTLRGYHQKLRHLEQQAESRDQRMLTTDMKATHIALEALSRQQPTIFNMNEVFLCSSAPVFIGGMDGTLLTCNKAFMDLLGYRDESEIPKQTFCRQHTFPEDLPIVFAHLNQLMITKEPQVLTKRIRHRPEPDGRRASSTLSTTIFLSYSDRAHTVPVLVGIGHTFQTPARELPFGPLEPVNQVHPQLAPFASMVVASPPPQTH